VLGELLLERKRPAEGLIELEAVMKKEPNRFRALYLGARAAAMSGNRPKASQYYRHVVEMCPKPGTDARPELLDARKRAGKT
jgi:Tfp pilus assembly protein PilF